MVESDKPKLEVHERVRILHTVVADCYPCYIADENMTSS